MITAKNSEKGPRTKPLFGKYFFLFLTTALIPVLIACISLFLSFQTLENELINSNCASTQLIQETLDIKVSELENTVLQMYSDPTFTNYALQNNPMAAIASLKQFVSLQECLDDIIILNKSSNALYSSTAKHEKNGLADQTFMKLLIQGGYSVEHWVQTLHEAREFQYWPTNAIDRPVNQLFLFSQVYDGFQYGNADSSRTVVFLISQDFLHNLFRSSQTNMDENILLLNADFEVLSYVAPTSNSEEILAICDKLKSNPQVVSNGYMDLDGKNLLFISHSQTTELYCVRFLSRDTAFQPLHRLVMLTMLILAFDFTVSVILIYVDIRKSYLPIRTLADSITAKSPHSYTDKNELSLFQQAYDHAFAQNERLTQTIVQSRQGLINHLMASLIQGHFSEEAFRNACNSLEIQFDKPYYCVCSILFTTPIPMQDEDTSFFTHLVTVIKKDLPDNVHVIISDMLFDKRIIVLLNSDCDAFSHYLSIISNMKAQIFEDSNMVTSIGIGSVCNTYENIGKSYLDSVNGLDYRMIYGKDCLITPDMCQNDLQNKNYPSQNLKQLYKELVASNTVAAINTIQQIHEYIKSQKCSLHSAKYICYDIFSMLKRLPEFQNGDSSATLSAKLDFSHLISFETVDEFFCILEEIITTLSSTAQIAGEDNICEQMIHYIRSNCFRYDFQINYMAEHFHISPQHMRKLFKAHTGTSISDYIAQLKLEKAMSLLRETDMGMNDIVSEIGNSDVSGFMRFFKKYTNQTPGQYRKKWRQGSTEDEL